MPELRNNFFEGILFRYESCSCDCVEDVQHVSKNEEPNRSYKLQAIPSENKLFAYAAQRGLVRIAKNGTRVPFLYQKTCPKAGLFLSLSTCRPYRRLREPQVREGWGCP